MAAHKCWIHLAVVHVSCPSPSLSRHSGDWSNIQAGRTAWAVLLRSHWCQHEAQPAEVPWELGAWKPCWAVLLPSEAPQMSLENWLALRNVSQGEQVCRQVSWEMLIQRQPWKRRMMLLFVVWFCLIASQQETNILVLVQQDGVNKEDSKLGTYVNRSPRAEWKTVY